MARIDVMMDVVTTSRVFKWAGRMSSSVLLLGTTSYISGFFVVNSYLYEYGISPFDFVQPRYVSAGLLYLCATVFGTAFLWFTHGFIRNKVYSGQAYGAEQRSTWALQNIFVFIGIALQFLVKDKTDMTWSYDNIGVYLLFLVLSFSFVELFLNRLRLFAGIANWWSTVIIEQGFQKLTVFTLLLLYISTISGFKAFTFYFMFLATVFVTKSVVVMNPNQTSSDKVATVAMFPLLSLALLWCSLYFFGTYSYPYLPSAIGGGKPSLVSLALKEANAHTIAAMMGREKSDCVLHNIEVIHENNQALYVLPHGYYSEEAAIAIPKSEIVSVAYQKSRLQEQSSCY